MPTLPPFPLHAPVCPGGGLLAVSQHHLIVGGEVLLDEVKGVDTEGLRDQARLEGGSSVEGHEEGQGPHVVDLIMLLSPLPKQETLSPGRKTTMAPELPTSSYPTEVDCGHHWDITQRPTISNPLLFSGLSTFLSPASGAISLHPFSVVPVTHSWHLHHCSRVPSLLGSHLHVAHEPVVTVLQELRAEVSEEESHTEGRAALSRQLLGGLAMLRHSLGLLSQI